MGQTLCFQCHQALEENDGFRSLIRACDSCLVSVLSSPDERLTGYLESLDNPAAVVSPDFSILFANGRFMNATDGRQPAGLRVGEALGCTYARTLGQCGETVPCILCHLKQAVEATLQSGAGLRGVPMSYPHERLERKAFSITTQKVSGGVLLILGPA
jgi:cytochrome c